MGKAPTKDQRREIFQKRLEKARTSHDKRRQEEILIQIARLDDPEIARIHREAAEKQRQIRHTIQSKAERLAALKAVRKERNAARDVRRSALQTEVAIGLIGEGMDGMDINLQQSTNIAMPEKRKKKKRARLKNKNKNKGLYEHFLKEGADATDGAVTKTKLVNMDSVEQMMRGMDLSNISGETKST